MRVFGKNRQKGASIVAVVMAGALLALVSLLSARAFRNMSQASKTQQSINAYQEIEPVLLEALARQANSFVAAGCPTHWFNHLDGKTIGNLAVLKRQPLRFLGSQGELISAPQGSDRAIARCTKNSSPVIEWSDSQPPVSRSFYACVNYESRNFDSNKKVFTGITSGFIEVALKIQDIRTGELVRCDLAKNAKGMRTEIAYTFHWLVGQAENIIYKSNTGVVKVAL